MKLLRLLLLVICAVASACGGGGGGTTNAKASIDSFPARIAAFGPPPFFCGQPGQATQVVMQKLNAFWQSNVYACACQPDALANRCAGNAIVYGNGYGYIFYDKDYLNGLDIATGSHLPADFFLSHEFGHNIQMALGLNPPGKGVELQADCLGGFYVGYQARTGQVTAAEVLKTFQFACSIGDPVVSPWWVSGAHGICTERAAALQRGIDGYLAGLLPGQACS
jgi:hypothetical protein